MSKVEVVNKEVGNINKVTIKGNNPAVLFGMAYHVLNDSKGNLVKVAYKTNELTLYLEVDTK